MRQQLWLQPQIHLQSQELRSRSELSSRNQIIDPNICCMCFVTYEDDVLEGAGASWISCACGRWLHEDCAEDQIINDNGKERNCSFCLDLLCC